MKRSTFLISLLACALSACANDSTEPVGQISLPLAASDSSGVTYRLRSATFTITSQGGGYGGHGGIGNPTTPTIVASTEESPDAQAITKRVLPGSYTVGLSGDWYLERITAAGTERVQQVVLLSPASQYTYVWDGGTARVSYQFGVDGTLIDFRNGDLSIDIDVLKPGERGGAGGTGGAGGA